MIPVLLVLFCLIIAGGGATYYFLAKQKDASASIELPISPVIPKAQGISDPNYIRTGWQADASRTLTAFLEGKRVEEKLPHILDAVRLRSKLDLFYSGLAINDKDTPADSFSVRELPEEVRKRGIFMLTYDQPPGFSKEDFFRPLPPLEVQYGIEEADRLFGTTAGTSHFAADPLRVHAFFKWTKDGLKLDWEIFAQTKYRTLRRFTELPNIGARETFRVLIVEDAPDKGHDGKETRTYLMKDPANLDDLARVNVKTDSPNGKELSAINWIGTKDGKPITRTATVELEWAGTPDKPVLSMRRFICWEFLGLGGTEIPATAIPE